jgi:hypothetical protein
MYVHTFIQGKLYSGEILRMPQDVTIERLQIEEYFNNDINTQSVIFADIKSEFLLLEKGYTDLDNLDISIKLQLKVNIFNEVTALQVLSEYTSNSMKQIFSSLKKNVSTPPYNKSTTSNR